MSRTAHPVLRTTRRQLIFDTVGAPAVLSDSSIPVDVLRSSSNEIITTIPHCLSLPPSRPLCSTLSDHLANLLDWQRPLLDHVDHLCPLANLLNLLRCSPSSTSNVLAATDGGAKNDIGSFGWTIRHDDVDLVTCCGTVPGPNPGSYRSECYGVLSLLLYLHFLTCESPAPLPYCQLSVHLDCQSLISKLALHQSRTYYTPSEAVGPERDVLLQIEYYLDRLSICFSFSFVKGHQDDHHPIHALDSPSLANIKADSLASSALESASSSPTIPLLPASHCNLVVSGIPITRRFGHQIRHLVFDRPMRHYILGSREWSFTCDIDWEFYHTLCHQESRRPNFFIKWSHRLLPVGHVVHRRNAKESPNCPACDTYEDHDHFLSCSHPTRHHLHRQLLRCLRTRLECCRTDPILCDILLEGVLSVLHSRPFVYHLFPHRYQVLCQSQCSLGWCNLLKGFCSVHWRQLHSSYCIRTQQPTLASKPLILHEVHYILDYVVDIWLFRNDQRHGMDTEFHESERSRQTVASIIDLYNLRASVLPCDRHLFFDSVDEHLSQPQSSLRAWLTNHSHHLFRSHQQAILDNVTHTNPITSYFS